MLSTKTKKQLRNAALAGIVLSFALLYLGAAELENSAVTTAGLVTAGVTAVISWLAF